MRMPEIGSCDATSCSYNDDTKCRALAVTVGHGDEANCDTFWSAPQDGGDPTQLGQVGACRADDCEHNERLVCTASSVDIGRRGETVDCLTFDRS